MSQMSWLQCACYWKWPWEVVGARTIQKTVSKLENGNVHSHRNVALYILLTSKSHLAYPYGSSMINQVNKIYFSILRCDLGDLCQSPQILPLFVTDSVGIVITGPVHVLKSQNKLYLFGIACRYHMDILNKREWDLQVSKIYKATFMWLCTFPFPSFDTFSVFSLDLCIMEVLIWDQIITYWISTLNTQPESVWI